MTKPQKILILGGSGLIGSAIARDLQSEGHAVRTVSRSPLQTTGSSEAIALDLTRATPAEWESLLDGVTCVINAAGALQEGLRDRLEAIHVDLIRNLIAAIGQRPIRVIQISAAGVGPEAATAFLRTKAEGDALLASSDVDHVIFRPTLVLSPQAYGGTALLRAAAALPGVVPSLLPDTKIQTVFVEDICIAVRRAVEGEADRGAIIALTEPDHYNFPELVGSMRQWLSFPPGRPVPVPGWMMWVAGKKADVAGWLGWHSPMRSTALKTLQDGIQAEPHPDFPCRALRETLAAMPATAQDRRFARSYLTLPLAIVTLSLFWIASGLIALIAPTEAAKVLDPEAGALAMSVVLGGAVVDIALGIAVALRRTARYACAGMIAVSLGYIAGAVLLAPDLWSDPLGPMVKVFPGIALALLTASLLNER